MSAPAPARSAPSPTGNRTRGTMANTFPTWTRQVSPQGRLRLPDNEHSLAESFGAGLSKVGDWLKDRADHADDKPKADVDKGWSADQAPDQGWSFSPDDSWNQDD